MKGLTQVQVHRLVLTCAGMSPIDLRDLSIIVLGIETGIQRKALVGLRFADVDRYSMRYVARGTPHTAPISSLAMSVLDAWMAWLREHSAHGYIFRRLIPRIVKGKRIYKVSKALSVTRINDLLKERARAAGIERLTMETFRSTLPYATPQLVQLIERLLSEHGGKPSKREED